MNTIVTGHQQQISRWDAVLASDNVAPDDARIYNSAACLHLDRSAARFAADQPDWLTRTVGLRPTAPAAVQVWDDAVRDVARFRATHHVIDSTTPLGTGVPHAPAGRDAAATRLAEARVWLDTYSSAPTAPLPTRSLTELVERRVELDVILATAPADQRHVVQALANGQLTLGDTTEILRDALSQQGDRRRWILEHWPHIVESAEIERGFATATSAGNMPFELDGELDVAAHDLMLDLD